MKDREKEELAKKIVELLQGKINNGLNDVFITPSSNTNEPFTMDSILNAKNRLDAIGPIATRILIPFHTYNKMKDICEPIKLIPSKYFLGLGCEIPIEYDWNLRNHYIVEYSDGSKDVKWINSQKPHSFDMN